ncbi:MAG: gamma-glutamylcyclotransferase family protein [Pseudomonadota bacterium]|mgnify:CR=1 FL=1|nr:hypothetical protein [Pseudomonadales bacterium]MDY6919865.1 gamma-glutamylcyclotransferase family protein [Pseudomonadota bacterium]
MLDQLFAYGTLQLPEITTLVLGRALYGEPAELPDYHCGRVARANFPGIVPSPGARVSGTLFTGLKADDWPHLDRYEGELYRRVQVNVALTGSGQHTRSWVYVMVGWAQDRVTQVPWTIEWYRRQSARRRLTYRNGQSGPPGRRIGFVCPPVN